MIQREINFQQVLQKCLKSNLSFTQPLSQHTIVLLFEWHGGLKQTQNIWDDGPKHNNRTFWRRWPSWIVFMMSPRFSRKKRLIEMRPSGIDVI